MRKKKISDAVTNISAEYIEKAADYTVTKKAHKPAWLKLGAMAACLVVLAGIGVRHMDTTNSPDTDTDVIMPGDACIGTEDVGETGGESPVYYSSLMLADSVLNEETLVFSEPASMDITSFDESTLFQHCCMIIEGTVVNLYVKHYAYGIYSDKFEKNGILHGRTDTIVYEVAVDKTWFGEDVSGDTILIEDTSCFIEPILAVKEGGRYVLPLYEYGNSIRTPGHEYAGGDITRETAYSTIYPYHPQIEVTNDGSYLVSQDWTTLVANNAREVIMDTLDEEDYWKDKMYLVDENTFANQMAILVDGIYFGVSK